MKRIRKNEGFTLIELLIVVAIIGIIAAIAVPGLLRARMSGNEASAIGSLRAINSAQASFASSCGGGFYAPSLVILGTPPIAGSTAFISPDLGYVGMPDPIAKSGYSITMASSTGDVVGAAASCNGAAVQQGYNATATATAGGGTRDFGTNTTATIYQVLATGAAIAMTDTTAPVAASAIQ